MNRAAQATPKAACASSPTISFRGCKHSKPRSTGALMVMVEIFTARIPRLSYGSLDNRP